MVIHQFNKLIRNKWVWGAFAIAISAFFAFDFLLDDLQRDDRETRSSDGAGKLAGESIDAKAFAAIAEEIRGLGRNRDWKAEQSEVNRLAWENYAMLQVAGKAGIEATDAEVMAAIRRDPSFQANGAFSFPLYERLLRENSMTPEQFEASLKRRITLMRVGRHVLGSAVWTSPMELDQAIADMTDVFTVKVARFTQDKKAADAVKLDDAGLRKWYVDNTNSLALPERTKIRYLKFDATDAKVLAKMNVSENDLRDRYDATTDKYTTTDTNGVETVKKFEEVKDKVEKEVRQIAAIEYFETNINARAYGVKAAKGSSRLDELAKEDGLKVEPSDWFATDGAWQAGFMKRPYQARSASSRRWPNSILRMRTFAMRSSRPSGPSGSSRRPRPARSTCRRSRRRRRSFVPVRSRTRARRRSRRRSRRSPPRARRPFSRRRTSRRISSSRFPISSRTSSPTSRPSPARRRSWPRARFPSSP